MSSTSPTDPPQTVQRGGIARTPGNRTPGRVHWAGDQPHSAESDSPRPQVSHTPDSFESESGHALDEYGMDPEALRRLTEALELHRSDSESRRKRRPKVIDFATGSSFDVSASSTRPPSPVRQVPGEAVIEQGETTGLPDENLAKLSRGQARNIVRAHKNGLWSSKHGPSMKPSSSRHQDSSEKRSSFLRLFTGSRTPASAPDSSDEQTATDVESSGQRTPPVPKLGSGVLSALLALYDSQYQDQQSRTPSGATTPIDTDSDTEHTRHKRWKPSLPSAASFNSRSRDHHHSRTDSSGALRSLISTSASAAAVPTLQSYQRPGLTRSAFSLDRALPTRNSFNRASSDDGTAVSWASTLAQQANESVNSIKNLAKKAGSSPGTPIEWDEKDRSRREREKRRQKKKREAYITRHVAEIIQRQEFILKLARCFMMFGSPSHRLVAQMQATAKVLDIHLSCMYLPDMMLFSFDDASTGTSNIKLIRQGSSLDLGKLQLAHGLYWKVIYDNISASDASKELSTIMCSKPVYKTWQLIFIGGVCSAAICIVSFGGSFIDALISFPLGALLVAIQLFSVNNELYNNIFEITVALLLSFLSAIFASTHQFCYPAVTSGAVVLILPGYITLNGALELSSRSIVSGAVRIGHALIYSLFLGFGLAIGAEIYQAIFNRDIYGAADFQCSLSHADDAPWYRQTPSLLWDILLVPLYSLALSMRNHQPWNRRELYLSTIISCIGWVTNHFVSLKFPNQSDITAAVGAFVVGVVANLYGRFVRIGHGNAFVVMVTGIMFQLPSGLGPSGLLAFAQQQTSGNSNAYLSGFQTALQLISVGIGLTVGLGISLVVVHPFQSKRKGGGVFSL